MQVKIGLIRVITLNDEEKLNKHGRLIEKYFPDLEVLSKSIPDQPFGIYDDETEKLAIPKILRLGKRLEQEDKVNLVIMSCAADPGVKELRKCLSIPVFGAGSAVASLALSYGERIGVIGISEELPPVMKEIFSNHNVYYKRPAKVNSTLDLFTKDIQESAFDVAKELEKARCNVIALACTGFSSIGIAKELEKFIGIPVLDPVMAVGLIAHYYILKNFQ
jgi:Asp/Glu/hydantoin racemase